MDIRKTVVRSIVVAAMSLTPMLSGCQVQWVSPYNADLQKKASDLLADVVAWEAHMRSVAGTAAADPRNPDVQAKLNAWRGAIEAMSEIEVGIDPGSTSCDAVLGIINGGVAKLFKKDMPTTPAASGGSGGLGLSSPQPITHCETLPGIFTRMMKQVGGVGNGDSAADPEKAKGLIEVELEQQCQLSWLSDDYFATLQEQRATAGAASPARPATTSAAAGTPTPQQQADAKAHCSALFVRPQAPVAGSIAVHGDAVAHLVLDLDAIIYREGRQAPPATK